jgi:hypothetical protein
MRREHSPILCAVAKPPAPDRGVNILYDDRPRELTRWRRMQVPIIGGGEYALLRVLGPTLRFETIVCTTSKICRNAASELGAGPRRCGAAPHPAVATPRRIIELALGLRRRETT